MRNVARTWAYETGILVGDNLESELPYNDYYEYFAPDYELDVRPSNMDNANTKDYLDKIRSQVVENLKRTSFAPSVQMTDVPRNPLLDGMDDDADDVLDDLDEDENKDKRFTQRRFDQYVEKPGELSESEDEEEAAANGVRRQPGVMRRRNITNYRNLDPGDSGLDSGMATPQDASSVGDGDIDSAMDAKMTDAPRTDPDLSAAGATSQGQGTPFTDVDRMAVESENNGASAVPSQQISPPAHDEDTAMEDAAPASAPEPYEPTDEAQDQKPETMPVADNAAQGPLSPPRAQSPLKESSAPAEKGPEASALEPAPAGEPEAAKTATAESTEEPKKEE
jgi:histone deacetylase 1/2